MSEDMQKIIACMQEAVDAEMERKAKLGYNAVVADKNGRPKIVSAKYLVRKRPSKCSTAQSSVKTRPKNIHASSKATSRASSYMPESNH